MENWPCQTHFPRSKEHVCIPQSGLYTREREKDRDAHSQSLIPNSPVKMQKARVLFQEKKWRRISTLPHPNLTYNVMLSTSIPSTRPQVGSGLIALHFMPQLPSQYLTHRRHLINIRWKKMVKCWLKRSQKASRKEVIFELSLKKSVAKKPQAKATPRKRPQKCKEHPWRSRG